MLAATGMAVAFGAQMAMGPSWRVGVRAGDEGPLITAGPFRISRNPTSLGQFLLLGGVLLASPSLLTLAGLMLFAASASIQIRSEEHLLQGPKLRQEISEALIYLASFVILHDPNGAELPDWPMFSDGDTSA